MITVLAILLIQPVIAGISMPYSAGLQSDRALLAQDAGIRIDPEDLTEHVPVDIDGTDDFVSQGWPGSGLPADPYIIAGLNITQDLGMYMISIKNTTASFVIRDCWIYQGASTHAIFIEDTTSATLEYNTIDSEAVGVYCNNANDTLFSHNIISQAGNNYAVRLYYSSNCIFVGNEIRSSYRGIYGSYSPSITFNGNLWDSSNSWYSTYLEHCNGTTSTDDMIIVGYSFYVRYSYDISITNMHNNGSGGVETFYGSGLTINDCNLDSIDGPAILISGTDNVDITNCYMTAPNDYGVSITFSDNVTFHGNTIENIISNGISFSQSNNMSIVGNTLNEVGSNGYYFTSCDFITFDDNSISNVLDETGIYLTDCNNGTITNSYIGNVANSGIEIVDSHNWTIVENEIEYVSNEGIHLNTGNNVVITGNTISFSSQAMGISSAPNITISNNHVMSDMGIGIDVDSCSGADIIGNTIDDAEVALECDSSNNVTIENNVITNAYVTGIDISQISYGRIAYNTIGSGPLVGINGEALVDCEIIGNTMTDCGFYFVEGILSQYYHEVENNTVNGLPVFYEPDDNDLDLLASDYGQILLVNNSWVDIHDNTYGLVTLPVIAAYSANIEIWNLETSGNFYGLAFQFSDNITVTDFVHHGSSDSGGIVTLYVDNMTLLDSEITHGKRSNNVDGFYAYYPTNLFINGCLFYGNEIAINIVAGIDVLISNNHLLNSESHAMFFDSSNTDNITIRNNVILNATNGIRSSNADHFRIIDNLIMYCSSAGIYFSGSSADYANITMNTIENNYDGIYVSSGDSESITNNTIRWNERYGVYLTGSAATEVYYNIIALNRQDNGYDSQTGNYWDDGSVLGNWWDDYTPPPPYMVDTDTADSYPMQYAPTEPIISQPQNIYYAEGSEGNYIEWFAFDDALRDWEVEIDGSYWNGDAWNYTSIKVSIDGLVYGTYEVVITLWDVDLNSVQDTAIVHVYDDTPPIISNTPNTWVFTEGVGQTLSWEVSDLHPDSYIVYVDGEEWDSGSWTTGMLEIDVDGMTEGEHSLRTVIFDIDGNSAGDAVEILAITDDVDPIIDSPSDFSYYLGETENIITWNVEDDYPDSFEITYNGTVYLEGAWGGSRIVINVDGLLPGTHTFALTVFDRSGNSNSDSVIVTVLQVAPETTPPPELDVGLILLVAGVIGAVVVVLVVVMFLRKRQG